MVEGVFSNLKAFKENEKSMAAVYSDLEKELTKDEISKGNISLKDFGDNLEAIIGSEDIYKMKIEYMEAIQSQAVKHESCVVDDCPNDELVSIVRYIVNN